MHKAKTSKFTGDLAKPIRWTGPECRSQAALDLLYTDEERDKLLVQDKKLSAQANATLLRETFRKLELLAKYYGIESDDPQIRNLLLLLYMCRDFVPGFQIERQTTRRGRKTIWDAIRYTELVTDVEAVKKNKRVGDRDAIRVLIRAANKEGGRYKSKGTTTLEAATNALEARLSEARRPQHNLLAPIFEKGANLMGSEQFKEILINSFKATEIRK